MVNLTTQCASGLHGFCRGDRASCSCTDCHLGPCIDCGTDNLQRLYDGRCASCTRRLAVATKSLGALCDNDPSHGQGFRNPATRRNEYLCMQCHAASGSPLTLRVSDVQAIAACATEDITSTKHVWRHFRGNRFKCKGCGRDKYDAALRKEMLHA